MVRVETERVRIVTQPGAMSRRGNMFVWEWDVLVRCVGEENALKVVAAFGGMRIYFPQKVVNQKRKEMVYRMYESGEAVAHIAGAVGWSESYIRSIIRSQKKLGSK